MFHNVTLTIINSTSYPPNCLIFIYLLGLSSTLHPSKLPFNLIPNLILYFFLYLKLIIEYILNLHLAKLGLYDLNLILLFNFSKTYLSAITLIITLLLSSITLIKHKHLIIHVFYKDFTVCT